MNIFTQGFLIKRLLSIFVYLFLSASLMTLQAEGSKDLYPKNDSQAKRSYLMARGGHGVISAVSAFDPYPTAGTMRVYAKAGETIYTGSSIVGMRAETSANNWTSRGDIVMISPNGTVYRLSNLHDITVVRNQRIGLIENYTEEQAGPAYSGNNNGYLPFTRVVSPNETGIWEIHFLALGNLGTNIPGVGSIGSSTNRSLHSQDQVQPTITIIMQLITLLMV